MVDGKSLYMTNVLRVTSTDELPNLLSLEIFAEATLTKLRELSNNGYRQHKAVDILHSLFNI